jgi:hypothetical protein
MSILSPDPPTICPACLDSFAFQWSRLGSSVVLVCLNGCPGRRIAAALDLDTWPEYVPPARFTEDDAEADVLDVFGPWHGQP